MLSSAADLGAIRRHPIWTNATEASLRALARHGEDLRLAAGGKVLATGEAADRIHLLLDGAVRVYYPAQGGEAEVTVKLFWAPAAFGDAESILRVRWAETVEALTPVRVIVVPARAYFAILQRDAAVCFRQYWDMGRRFGVAIQTERAAHFDEILDRVVALLVTYAHHFGQDGVIDYALTQEQIARQVNAKRRSVVRALEDLYRRGVIERRGRKLAVPSVDDLLEVSRGAKLSLSFSTDPRPWAEPEPG